MSSCLLAQEGKMAYESELYASLTLKNKQYFHINSNFKKNVYNHEVIDRSSFNTK